LNRPDLGSPRIRSIALRTILFSVNTEDSRLDFASEEEEGPPCFVDLSIKCVPIETFD
jgi:hypothetical protein